MNELSLMYNHVSKVGIIENLQTIWNVKWLVLYEGLHSGSVCVVVRW